MKKVLAMMLAIMLCLGTAACVYAEEAVDNEAVAVNEEAKVTLAKAGGEGESKSSGMNVGDLIRFIPTSIEVSSRKVQVFGYFVNLNSDYAVKNFRNFEMDVYLDGTLLTSGDFGTIHEFKIEPFGIQYQSFTYNGSHDLNTGSYQCDDRCYCVISCTFTSISR